MDAQDFRNLQEAYQDVYSIDEGIRSSLKRFLGRKTKEAEAPKPMSRGEVLRQRYNVGPEGSYTSAKRQILNRSRARAERDEDKYGGSIYTKKVADKSREAHNRYLKAGYSKYGADLKHGKGNKAARRAATLNREEYDFILSHLIDEGYTNTLNGAEVIASNMSDDWIVSILDEGYKRFPYKRVANKLDKMYDDPDTDIRFGKDAKRYSKMKRVDSHMKGEVPRTDKREYSPKMSKAKSKYNP